MKTFCKLGLVVVVVLFTTIGYADSHVICVEDPISGCTGLVINNGLLPDPVAGSDGESHWDPFGYGQDTSDGIDLSSFTGIVGSLTYIGAPGWVQLLDVTGAPSLVWVLPADLSGIGCGVENETTCEPVGVWTFDNTWVSGVIGTYLILNAQGQVSDTIILDNNGPNGQGQIIFTSDPGQVPEPSSLVLLGSGLIGAAGAIRRRLLG